MQVAINFHYDAKFEDGDWWHFNNSFSNLDISPRKLAIAIYRGHPYTTQHYHRHNLKGDYQGKARKTAYRHRDNFLAGQHLALDFDTEDERSHIQALAKDSFIGKYAAILHTTTSHREDAPRTRVVFVLESSITEADRYAAAATSLVERYGHCDKACKDPARSFWGAKGCQIMLREDRVLPDEMVTKLVADYRRPQPRTDFHPQDLDEERIVNALSYIPPRMDYQDWLRVLMAVHSILPNRRGIEILESWSPGYPGEIEEKFRSFAQSIVSIATLYWLAQRHGWVSPEEKERRLEQVLYRLAS